MSMKLTRREALKGVAAFGAISFMPAGAFAAAADRGNVATTSFDDGWLFLVETSPVRKSRPSTPHRGARSICLTTGPSKIFRPTPRRTAAVPFGKTATVPKPLVPSAECTAKAKEPPDG